MQIWRNILSSFGPVALSNARCALCAPCKRFGRCWHTVEIGASETYEFIVFAPMLVLLLAMIAAAALVRSAEVPVWAAARECARVASASASGGASLARGAAVGRRSLAVSGFDSARAQVMVSGGGSRGAAVTCSIVYNIGLDGLPMAWAFGADGGIEVRASTTLLTEAYRSEGP
jgi:hypothetical protein